MYLRNCVHDHPTLVIWAVRDGEHEDTEEHDHRILDETIPATNPVTEKSYPDLSDYNTDDLEVVSGLSQGLAAGCERLPATRVSHLVESFQVSDGEENVTFRE